MQVCWVSSSLIGFNTAESLEALVALVLLWFGPVQTQAEVWVRLSLLWRVLVCFYANVSTQLDPPDLKPLLPRGSRPTDGPNYRQHLVQRAD